MSDELIPRPPDDAIEAEVQNKLVTTLAKYKKTIYALLPKMIDPKRFGWLAITAIRENPALAAVTPASFINSVMLACQMEIEIRRDSAYLVPFGQQCQLLIDYKAKIGLARRSGAVAGIQAVAVREADEFDWHYGPTGVVFKHRPKWELPEVDRGRFRYFYAFAQVGNGIQFREPMSILEIDRRRKLSRAGVAELSLDDIYEANELDDSGKPHWASWAFRDKRRQPWVCWFEQQALKTLIHSLCKGLPLDHAAQLSQEVDAGIETGKQPDLFGEILGKEIDPVDERKPMIEPASKEEFAAAKAEMTADPSITFPQARQRAQAKAKPPLGKVIREHDDFPVRSPELTRSKPVNEYDDFPVECTEDLIYIKGVLYRPNHDKSAWVKVEHGGA